MGPLRFNSVARDKGELLHRRRLLQQAYAEVHRELVHILTIQAKTRGRSERLRTLVRDLEGRMTALERQMDEIHAGLIADVNATRRAGRVALWRA